MFCHATHSNQKCARETRGDDSQESHRTDVMKGEEGVWRRVLFLLILNRNHSNDGEVVVKCCMIPMYVLNECDTMVYML